MNVADQRAWLGWPPGFARPASDTPVQDCVHVSTRGIEKLNCYVLTQPESSCSCNHHVCGDSHSSCTPPSNNHNLGMLLCDMSKRCGALLWDEASITGLNSSHAIHSPEHTWVEVAHGQVIRLPGHSTVTMLPKTIATNNHSNRPANILQAATREHPYTTCPSTQGRPACNDARTHTHTCMDCM